jgi:transglutaminase-like putative cysteine protease
MTGTRTHGRFVGLAAVALVAGAGCLRLFEGAGWVVPALLAVVGAQAAGALTRRWPAIAVAAVQGAGLLLLLLERVGGHTAYGIPTPATFTALARVVGRAPEALRAAIVPAPTTPELILLVVTGLWVAVAAADWLARRRRAGLLALLPLTAFPVVVAALGTGRGRVPLTFAFAASSCAYAALDRAAARPANEAVPLRAAPARTSPPALRGRLGLAGPALAVGLAAVVLGPVVPGIGRAVVDVHALGVTLDVSRVELNPLVDIQPQLLTERQTELFTVRSVAPAYWRLTALDRFDGRRWSPSRPALYRHDGPTSEGIGAGNQALHQDYALSALDSPWLPAAGKAIRVRASGARLDPETDSLVTKKGSRFVRAYRVESRLPPDPFEPRPSAGSPAVEPAALARHLTLPRNFPAAVRQMAQRFTAGATTPFERAAALEDSLRVGFIYDESAPAGASMNALSTFLLSSRRGYCEQFAGAYAAMARALGLPTRVAVGFTPGTYDESAGVWRVTTREAHAWPEVFLAGLGWTPFEPTPGRVLPDPDTRVRPSSTVERLASARAAGGTDATALARIDPGAAAGVDAGPGGRPGGLAGAVTHRRTVWWLGAAVLGLLAVPPAMKTRRRNNRRRAPAGEAVLGAWWEALDRLGEAGLARRANETPLEFARRAGTERPGAAPALRRLAFMVNGAAYSEADHNSDAEAWAASDRTVRALDAHDPHWLRWRRRLDPRPLLRR